MLPPVAVVLFLSPALFVQSLPEAFEDRIDQGTAQALGIDIAGDGENLVDADLETAVLSSARRALLRSMTSPSLALRDHDAEMIDRTSTTRATASAPVASR